MTRAVAKKANLPLKFGLGIEIGAIIKTAKISMRIELNRKNSGNSQAAAQNNPINVVGRPVNFACSS